MIDPASARKIEKSALATRRRVLGEEHPVTLAAMNNLAYMLWQMNEQHPAAQLMRGAAEQMQAAIDQAKPGQPLWRHLV